MAKKIQYPMFRMLAVFTGLFFQTINTQAYTLPAFSAVYNARKRAVVIKWEHSATGIKTYVVQQTAGNTGWQDIALQEITPSSGSRSFYFEHKQTSAGENHYRLKCIYQDGHIEYGKEVLLIIAPADNRWVMYPVPVTSQLTLEYRGNGTMDGVIHVIIQQPAGKTFTKLRYASLSRQIKIPLDNLPKGLYDIRIVVQDEVIWEQRFVK